MEDVLHPAIFSCGSCNNFIIREHINFPISTICSCAVHDVPYHVKETKYAESLVNTFALSFYVSGHA